MFLEEDDSDSDYSPKKPLFKKQQALKGMKIEDYITSVARIKLNFIQLPLFQKCISCFILHEQQIRYRTPSLKPLQFFEKNGKKEESKNFISILCGYLEKDYKLIFIDECSLGNISICSHKQWHILGSFKQTFHRISSFKYLIGALGQGGFLYFQLFEGTGKAYIFQDFVTSIINKAKEYYNSDQFVLVMDNSAVHKSGQMKQICNRVPCIFTPAYRPEFNAIEHMFGWLN